MSRAFALPDLGEGIHEGEVLAVMVAVGDDVREGAPIMEVETDKAAVEIPSPYTGTVTAVHVNPGDIVNVGDVMVTFSDDDTADATPPPPAEAEAPATVQETQEATPTPRVQGPVPASPATRRLARQLGVDLRAVTPTGPGGLVTADDVKAFADGAASPEATDAATTAPPAPAALSPATPVRPLDTQAPELPDFDRWGPTERIPVRSIRRAVARQMAIAWEQIPHVSNQNEVDLTRLDAFRRRKKGTIEDMGGKLTLTVFALKAAAAALRQFPNFNASLDSGAGHIVRKHYFHIGVAVDTPDGLVVPVVRDVDRKSLTELAIELNELVARARDRKLAPADMQGGTFTITNIGPMGGGHFTPIINYPEVAIMGMGTARMQPVVRQRDNGRQEIVPRLIMPLVLSVDHRVLDGADAARFMNVVIHALEDPEDLLLTIT